MQFHLQEGKKESAEKDNVMFLSEITIVFHGGCAPHAANATFFVLSNGCDNESM